MTSSRDPRAAVRESTANSTTKADLFEQVFAVMPWLRLRACQLVSLVLHVGVAVLLSGFVQSLVPRFVYPPVKVQADPPKRIKVRLAPPRQKKDPSTVAPIQTRPSVAPPVVRPPIKVKDSDGLRISFAPDPANQGLLQVMRQLRASIGFSSPDEERVCSQSSRTKPSPTGSGGDPPAAGSSAPKTGPIGAVPECLYDYRIDATAWTLSEGRYSLGGYFLVRVGPPDPQFVSTVRSRYSIDSHFTAYALLPDTMRIDIDDLIADEKARDPDLATKTPTEVEITFAALEPHHMRLRIISVASKDSVPPDAAHTDAKSQ